MSSSLWRAAFSKWNLLSSIIETAYYYPLIQIYNGPFLEILVYNHYFTIIVNVHNSWYISRVYSKYPININFQPFIFSRFIPHGWCAETKRNKSGKWRCHYGFNLPVHGRTNTQRGREGLHRYPLSKELSQMYIYCIKWLTDCAKQFCGLFSLCNDEFHSYK